MLQTVGSVTESFRTRMVVEDGTVCVFDVGSAASDCTLRVARSSVAWADKMLVLSQFKLDDDLTDRQYDKASTTAGHDRNGGPGGLPD